ncbi:MAG: hypothetical protein [Olavius algarvensis Delta 4 endosymbiont]|nr:MAG: hypothetical protein [Olavius algarvensis Delta 4 endosymbiont]
MAWLHDGFYRNAEIPAWDTHFIDFDERNSLFARFFFWFDSNDGSRFLY